MKFFFYLLLLLSTLLLVNCSEQDETASSENQATQKSTDKTDSKDKIFDQQRATLEKAKEARQLIEAQQQKIDDEIEKSSKKNSENGQ